MRTMPSWIRNRYAISCGMVLLLVAAWNVFVAFSDDGILTGKVVDEVDRPVSGATVLMFEAGLLMNVPRMRAVTDQFGHFRFVGHGLHHLQLRAVKAGVGESGAVSVRLYFKNQNYMLDQPLQIHVTHSQADSQETRVDHESG